jgi:iron complex outermembrane receptor protein
MALELTAKRFLGNGSASPLQGGHLALLRPSGNPVADFEGGIANMTGTSWKRALAASAFVLPLLLVPAARAAQEQAKPDQKKADQAKTDEKVKQAEAEGVVRTKEEVTVTGTLIPRKELTSLSPVTTVEPEEVTYQGTSRVEDLIQNMPQIYAAQNSSISNGASGTATVDMRYLGAVRTLPLLNGRRMASGDAFATSPDLNFIPTSLVKRVDLLSGGAGSVYGADAVSGVVNFVLDTEFQGFRGEVHWNGFQHNNSNAIAAEINKARGFSYPTGSIWNYGGANFNLAVGGKFGEDKGHAMAFVDYRDIGAITKDQRDYTNCSVLSPGASGPACGGSSTSPTGRFFTDDGKSWTVDPTTGNTFIPWNSTKYAFNYAPYNFMQRNDRRWSGGGFVHYTVSSSFEPYAEVMLMEDYSDAQIAPSGDFGNTLTINCDNPMMSDQERAIVCTNNGYGPNDTAGLQILRRNVEGGPRVSQLRHTNWRMLGGVRGEINSVWSYDAYGIIAQVSSPQSYANDLSVRNLNDALNVVGTQGAPGTWQCASGNPACVPWDVFSKGGVTSAALGFIAEPLVLDSGTQTKLVNGTLKADFGRAGVKLPGATEGISIAVGAEAREESLFVHPDANWSSTDNNGAGQGGPTLAVDGNYTSREAFAEVLVPLVQDRTGFQNLSLELGYRLANYKALGQSAKNNGSYKTLLTWSPVASVKLRGGFNRAVRAPNVQELFRPQGLNLGGAADICAGANPSASLEQCQHTGVTAAQYGHIAENSANQYNTLDGGNPQLNVEKANTWTGGIVFTPKSIVGLALTVDYWDIKIDNEISVLPADSVIQTCANTGDPTLCGLVHRDQFGSLWRTPNGYTIRTNQNVGQLKARGIDVSASYPLNLGSAGFVSLSLVGSSMLENRLTTPLFSYDCAGYFGNTCGVPLAKWRHRMRASWNTKFGATFSANWRYINNVLVDAASPNPDLGNPGIIATYKANDIYSIPKHNWFDLAVGYKIREKARLTVGCNNIFDKEPPLASGMSPNDYGPGFYGTYDYMGRALYASLQFEF